MFRSWSGHDRPSAFLALAHVGVHVQNPAYGEMVGTMVMRMVMLAVVARMMLVIITDEMMKCRREHQWV